MQRALMYRLMTKGCSCLSVALIVMVVAASATRVHAGVTATRVHSDVEDRAIPTRLPESGNPDDVAERLERLSPIEVDEVIWLARCMYSESDRPHEQELVAWVVRNRVETEYRGRSYREVILEAKQFSAFNEPSKRRDHILSLSQETPLRSWQRTLEIALDVYRAPAAERPFAQTVRHFYSPISMTSGRKPYWADGGKALSSSRLGVDRRRFIFFDDVDSHLAGLEASGPSTVERSVVAGRGGGDGFQLSLPKPSGKVGRPRRPSVVVPRSNRQR